MREEKEERKKQARSNKQTRQSNTAHPRQSLFPRKNELPQVGLEPTTLYTLDRALYQLIHVVYIVAKHENSDIYFTERAEPCIYPGGW